MRPDLYAPGSAYHQARRWTHPHSLRCLETACQVMGTPRSLVDMGCAEGVHVRWAREHGIDATGVDLAVPDGDPSLVRADLREPVDLRRSFEWVLCWEVAEHLPEESAETLVETLVRHMQPMGRILFTAAGPGQRGPGHVHCVAPRVWQGLFDACGVAYASEVSSVLRKNWLRCSPKTPWYGTNAMVFWRVA